jgi:hypothetical protein
MPLIQRNIFCLYVNYNFSLGLIIPAWETVKNYLLRGLEKTKGLKFFQSLVLFTFLSKLVAYNPDFLGTI